ncbi:MAG: hypothetical protein HY815_01370 [Candidatus Riflebacteria bacterium]|nr:hypothetical protein [Candidatus Riflebacteria bacterium]
MRVSRGGLWIGLIALSIRTGALVASPDHPQVNLATGRSQADLSRSLSGLKKALDDRKRPRVAPKETPFCLQDNVVTGEVGVAAHLLRQSDDDLRELETSYALPGAVSLSTVEGLFNMEGAGFGSFKVRNLTDDDRAAQLTMRQPGLYTGELTLERSGFVDTPPGARNRRRRIAGRVTVSRNPLTSSWLDFDLLSLIGVGSLGPRDWQRDRLVVGASADLGLAGATIEVPIEHFADRIDPINNVTSTGGALRLFSSLWGYNGSIGCQIHRIATGACPDDENLAVVDVTLLGKRVYRINGLESRTRYQFTFHRNQMTQTARTKSYAETFSTLTYRRYRKILAEMGGATRYVKRRRLDRWGIVDLLGRRNDLAHIALDPVDQENRMRVSEGWSSVSYRGVNNLHVNVRAEGLTVSSNPITEIGTAQSPPLHFDSRSGLLVDLVYNPYSPYWGASYKYKSETAKHDARSQTQDQIQMTAGVRAAPWPWLSLTGEVVSIQQEANLAVVRAGQTNAVGFTTGVVCDAGGPELFLDYGETRAAGALPGRESVVNLGFSTENRRDGTVSRLVLTRDRLSSESQLVVGFTSYLGSFERRYRF